ncbi:MAG: hypothetical protein LBV26_07775 [Bacteroidales bacterium]|jgi:hypothetical protein|nr:hypothetical protein [Bacteroidales bacterium]
MNIFKNHPLYGVHTIDTAMNSLWTFYRNNFARLFAVSLAMSGILHYASTFFDFASIQNETDIDALIEAMSAMVLPMLITALVNMLFSIVMQHYIMFSPVDEDNSILVSAQRSLKYFFPYLVTVILLSVLAAIAMVLGLIAFVIGIFFVMFYVMTVFLFILPVMMAENTDIGQTIGRVFRLAHKNFWANYGWVAVFVLLMMMLSFILSGLALVPFAGNFLKSIFNPSEAMAMAEIAQKPAYIILSAITGALAVPLTPLFAAILYFNGRAREEAEHDSVVGNERRVTVEDLYARPYCDDAEN